jgi:hypothetical protein
MHGSRSLSPARPDLAIALGSIFTHAVGAILYGVPKGPDESFT